MFLAAVNKEKQLLYSAYIEQVQPEDIERALDDVKALIAELSPGFRLLADLSQVTSIDMNAVPELGRLMELIDRSGVGMVVRVIPSRDKDIGMNILTVFHYPHHPRVTTCKSLAEAVRELEL